MNEKDQPETRPSEPSSEKLFSLHVRSLENQAKSGGFQNAEDAQKFTEQYIVEHSEALMEMFDKVNGPFWKRENWLAAMNKQIAATTRDLGDTPEYVERFKKEVERITQEKEDRNELV
jgi:hypothetical protein